MKKILIVDDQPGLLHIFREIFSDKEKYEIHLAATAYDAEEVFKKIEPDLLILDVALPDKDSRSLLDDLKKLPSFEKCQLVMMSGMANKEEIEATTPAPVALFLAKPFKIPEAAEKIVHLLD